jgi:hypothetical protein
MRPARKEIQKIEPAESVGSQILTAAKRALRIVNPKEMAGKLEVSESMISQWLNGAKNIPLPRQFEILKQTKLFLREQRSIEDHIDALMLMQFGKAED